MFGGCIGETVQPEPSHGSSLVPGPVRAASAADGLVVKTLRGYNGPSSLDAGSVPPAVLSYEPLALPRNLAVRRNSLLGRMGRVARLPLDES